MSEVIRVSRLFIVGIVAMMPAATLAGEALVKVQDGLVSATFDATPRANALDAIRRATGVELIVPPPVREKALTLAVEPAPFERFLEHVLQALELGGVALVYAPDGRADRLIVVHRGQESNVPTAVSATKPSSPPAGSMGRTSVPFLIGRAEAESIKLGSPGQVILVQSGPFAKVQTSGCDGSNNPHPVQTVLVADGANTYLTSIIACAPGGLNVGDALTPATAPTEARMEGDSTHSRFTATVP